MTYSRFTRVFALVLVLVLSALLPAISWSADKVNVRFSWKLKGEYGFLYYGDKMGVYAQENIDLSLGEGAGSPAALGALIQGQEDIVVLPGVFALSAIQKGMPIKIIALYQPQTPVVLISHADKPILQPKDLEGKSIAHSAGETGTSYLDVFCEINGVDCSKVQVIRMDSQSRVPQFVQKQVDVVSVYTTNDLPILEDRLKTVFPALHMADYGLIVPGLAIVTSENAIQSKPELLKRFLAANAKAIALTRDKPEAAAQALKDVWAAGPSVEVIQKQIEATMESFTHMPDHPVGYVDDALISQALKTIASVEELGEQKPLASFYSNEFLSD